MIKIITTKQYNEDIKMAGNIGTVLGAAATVGRIAVIAGGILATGTIIDTGKTAIGKIQNWKQERIEKKIKKENIETEA